MSADLAADVEAVLPVDGAAVDDLRRARRRRRVADIHWVDALYRAYVAGLGATFGVALLAGAVGDTRLDAAGLADVRAHGPAVLGLLVVVVLGVGLRSGSRGGPLALEAADVRHVLLAPVARGRVLREPAIRQVRFAVFAGAAVGAASGRFAARRFPASALEWVLVGAVFGVVVVACGIGAALVAGGRRLPRWAATTVAGVLVAWSIADVAEVGVPASPGRALGWLALWPVDPHPVSLVGPALAVGLVGLGLAGIAGVSLEAAERRTALVGQIRFAATLQDLRTVLVLRRQLAADRPRPKPWVRGRRVPARWPVWRRGWRGVLRFPAGRLLRMAILAGAAGVALRGVWAGTAPLVIPAGLALWLVGLDAVEPLAQEIDHPSRRESYALDQGDLLVRHLGVPGVTILVFGAVTAAVAVIPGTGALPVGAAAATAASAALAAGAGAVVNVVSGAPKQFDELGMLAPEVAGTRLVLRAVWPPLLAVIGTLPLLLVEAFANRDEPALPAAAWAYGAVAVTVALVGGWVRQREAIHAWWAEALEQSGMARASSGDEDGPDSDADAETDDSDSADPDPGDPDPADSDDPGGADPADPDPSGSAEPADPDEETGR